MNFISDDLLRYAEEHTSPESFLLQKINRDTHAQVMMPRMLSGHLQGRVLAMISRMIAPSNVLEIGTYTGYSAICLAEGLTDEGKLLTIDKNDELEERVRAYFNAIDLASKIEYIIGNAVDVIPSLEHVFDLVFIDADKSNYSLYYDLVIGKVRKGGYILADNVLWSGKVLAEKPDKDTSAIVAFNQKVQADDRVENVLLPVRDGIMVIRKR